MKVNTILQKVLLLSALCFFCSFAAFSEECYKISSVDGGNANVALRYLEQRDSTTLIYAVFTLPEDEKGPVLFNASRTIYVTDGDVNYKLVGAHNVPVADESMLEFSILEDKERKLNFILEFEKFPFDDAFDIVDDLSDARALNFRGVHVDASAKKDVKTERFLLSTKLPRCGQFYEGGNYNMYYVRDGVFVTCHSSYGDDHFTLYLSIVNDSDHGILFDTGKMTVTGHKRQGKDTVSVSLPLVSKNNYVSQVEASDRYTAEKESHSYALETVGSEISFASLGMPWRSAERVGMNVLGGLIRDIKSNSAKPYLAELKKTREERTKNYLQSQSIKAGESHSGFIQVTRPKKVNDYYLVLHMDGYDFEFTQSIKSK